MYSLLLLMIYLAFISLGLPDSLLGSAWPVMHRGLDIPLSAAGILTMLIASGTILSSLFSDKMTKRFGPGLVTAVSVFMTAVALFGFSISKSFLALALWTLPYGLGAGAVDAALNNYVALHFASRHMNWLHCFWGVGASISPGIMGFCLSRNFGWQKGYLFVAVLQILLTGFLFLSLPLWKQTALDEKVAPSSTPSLGLFAAMKMRGVPFMLFTFLGYCALEGTAGLWASSFLVEARGMEAEMAAKVVSIFYLGITVGRFLCGFVSDKIGDRRLIRFGILFSMGGIFLLCLPLGGTWPAILGLGITGFGCAPIYPSIIHSAPASFGRENSQAIIGIQMASAYTGSTFLPPLFGLLAGWIGMGLYPFYLLLFSFLMIFMSEKLNCLLPEK